MKKVITKVFSVALVAAIAFTLCVSAYAGYASGTVVVNGMTYPCSGSTCGDTSGVRTATTCAGTTIRYSELGVTFITDIYGYDGHYLNDGWDVNEYTGTVYGPWIYPTYPDHTTGIYAIGGTVGCCHDNTWYGTV